MTTTKQKLKLKALLKKLGGDGIDPYIADQLAFLFSEIERQVSEGTSPLGASIVDIQLNADGLRTSISEQFDLIEERAKTLGITYEGRIKDLRIALTSLIGTETTRLEKELHKFVKTVAANDTELAKKLEKIVKEIEELFWLRASNGSNNVQAVLNIKANGTGVAMNVTGINFATNMTVTTNPDGTVNVSALGGGAGVSFETPTGTVDGVNTTFTVLNIPKYIVVDGVQYFQDIPAANPGYTRSTLTLTLRVPPTDFIQSAY